MRALRRAYAPVHTHMRPRVVYEIVLIYANFSANLESVQIRVGVLREPKTRYIFVSNKNKKHQQ